MPKVKAKKQVWNTFEAMGRVTQIRLGKNGWEKRHMWMSSKTRGSLWAVDNVDGLEAFELAKTFRGGA